MDFNRLERKKTNEDLIKGVAEYAYGIPISFKILLAYYPQNTYSILWDYEHPISISGESYNGKKRLLKFLQELPNKNLYEPEYLEIEINKSHEFFIKNQFELKYFFLESGELYEMSDTPFEEQNMSVYNEVILIENTIKIFYQSVEHINLEIERLINKKNEKTKKTWLRKPKFVLDTNDRVKLEKEINHKKIENREMLGIDNWGTILYYHFGK